jgi:hypothetical protein
MASPVEDRAARSPINMAALARLVAPEPRVLQARVLRARVPAAHALPAGPAVARVARVVRVAHAAAAPAEAVGRAAVAPSADRADPNLQRRPSDGGWRRTPRAAASLLEFAHNRTEFRYEVSSWQ